MRGVVSLLILISGLLIVPFPVYAAPSTSCPAPLDAVPQCVCLIDRFGNNTSTPSIACLAGVIANLINVAFYFLGTVTLVMLLYGSIRFIISRGDPKAIEAAQKTITYALIGTVLVVGSFILVNIIFKELLGLPSILDNFSFVQ